MSLQPLPNPTSHPPSLPSFLSTNVYWAPTKWWALVQQKIQRRLRQVPILKLLIKTTWLEVQWNAGQCWSSSSAWREQEGFTATRTFELRREGTVSRILRWSPWPLLPGITTPMIIWKKEKIAMRASSNHAKSFPSRGFYLAGGRRISPEGLKLEQDLTYHCCFEDGGPRERMWSSETPSWQPASKWGPQSCSHRTWILPKAQRNQEADTCLKPPGKSPP